MEQCSGVGVLDKAVSVLVAVQSGPASLGALVIRTGLTRATAHRLARALEVHRLLTRDGAGQWVRGPRLAELATDSAGDALLAHAGPVLRRLRDQTQESAQLYLRRGDERVCVATAERSSGLRDTVPVGSVLPMTAGSAAQVLLAWEPAGSSADLLASAVFSTRTLSGVRRRGWARTAGEREPGVGSLSAPVRGPDRAVLAAVSVSGPVDRLGRDADERLRGPVVAAADELSRLVGGA